MPGPLPSVPVQCLGAGARFVVGAMVVAACTGEQGETPGEPPPVEEGYSLVEEAASRGLGASIPDPNVGGGMAGSGRGGIVALADIDGDHDLDVLLSRTPAPPALFFNDGQGTFDEISSALAEPVGALGHVVTAAAVADLDGDGDAEVIGGGPGFVSVWRNLGAGSFDAPMVSGLAALHATYEDTLVQQVALADIDGDRDLDVLAVGIDFRADDASGENAGAPDVVLRNDAGVLTPWFELAASGVGSRAMAAFPFDADEDGDIDIFVPGDLGPPTTLWRNDGIADGVPTFTDIAPESGLDFVRSAMGVDGADIDGDGAIDLCVTDVGPPACYGRGADGRYVDVTAAMGLDVLPAGEPPTIGWSLDLSDLNLDGRWDAVQGAGPDPPAVAAGDVLWPDLLWFGDPDGRFVERGGHFGFGDPRPAYGQAIGDVDGNHCPDILLAGPGAPPRLWMADCAQGSWLEVELAGPVENPTGVGATVRVTVGARSWTRVVTGARGQGQGSPILHFGLGDVDGFDLIEVRWPGGDFSSTGPGAADGRVVIPPP